MRRFLLFFMTGVMLLVALCMTPLSAFAAAAVTVTIPVEIEGGGTATIITEVNCPLPEASSLEVPNGMTEKINIVFTEPGDYSYRIMTEPGSDYAYTPDYYIASVSVKESADGDLLATTVLIKSDSTYKPDSCLFVRADQSPTEPSQPTESEPTSVAPTDAGSSVPTQPSKEPPTSRPKTGDDSMLDLYLIICILASAGLFALSLSYLKSTNRLINQ